MTHYKSLAVHNSACNEFYYRYQDCQEEHPFRRFFGCCEDLRKEMVYCIREQRVINRDKNRKLAEERREQYKIFLREQLQKEKLQKETATES